MSIPNWVTTKFIAHRGVFNNVDIPENSLAAFNEAIKNNFAIELDVQTTKDGVAVVFHDDTLDRVTNGTGILEEKTFDEIKDLTLCGTKHKIPTFLEVLECVNGRTELLVEIKDHKNVGEFEKTVLKLLRDYKGEFVVESFHPFIIKWFSKNAPDIVRGQLSGDFKDSNLPKIQQYLLSHLKLCKWNKSQFVAYNIDSMVKYPKLYKVTSKWRKKMPVIVYTIRSQEQHEQTKHMYDNMIFDSYVPEI